MTAISLEDELVQRFNALITTQDPEKFFYAFAEYVRFVQETPPLNRIARGFLASGQSPELNAVYKTLQRAWMEDDKAVEEMWADTNRKFLGEPTKYEVTSLFGIVPGVQSARAHIRAFHSALTRGLEHHRFGDKPLVLIRTKDGSVCFAADETRCYPIKKAGKGQRFAIILALSREPMSANALTKRIGKEATRGNQANIKAAIDKINLNFKRDVGVEYDLIVYRQHRSKNIYALNTEIFSFRTESQVA